MCPEITYTKKGRQLYSEEDANVERGKSMKKRSPDFSILSPRPMPKETFVEERNVFGTVSTVGSATSMDRR